MKNKLMLAFIIFAGWKFYVDVIDRTNKQVSMEQSPYAQQIIPSHQSTINAPIKVTQQQKFECDGRQHCSLMTSCAEATYFIQHCPGTKMDGDRDGIPCERQWCN